MDDRLPDAFTGHTIDILRVAAGHQQIALQALLDLETDLVGKVANARSLNARTRFLRMLEECTASIRLAYEGIEKKHRKQLAGLATVEAKATVGFINEVIGADVLGVSLSLNQLTAISTGPNIMGHSARTWWQGQDESLQQRFRGEMTRGQLLGETNEQLVRRVRGTAQAGYTDGVMAVSRREATSLVRTSALSTANAAREKTIEDLDDVVDAIQWVSTLDGRTTLICQGLSGKIWTIPDYKPVGHNKAYPGTTAHWNCRSTRVPVLKSWEELMGRKLPSLDNKKLEDTVKKKLAAQGMSKEQIEAVTINSRASMDGQVNKDLTMDEWLAKKDDTFIDKTLGPGRAARWNRGKGELSLSDLTDQNNRPLTLKQLDAKVSRGEPPPETKGLTIADLDNDGQFVPAPPRQRK